MRTQGTNVVDFMEEVNDFADTAAIIANLDLVISADTSVAHVAGAMGKPVWVLSRFDACWRWLRNRPNSPWLPHGARVWADRARKLARRNRRHRCRAGSVCKSIGSWLRSRRRQPTCVPSGQWTAIRSASGETVCNMKDIFLNWHLGNNFGWGILGLNLFCHWANDRDVPALDGPTDNARSPGVVRCAAHSTRPQGDRWFEPLSRSYQGRARRQATPQGSGHRRFGERFSAIELLRRPKHCALHFRKHGPDRGARCVEQVRCVARRVAVECATHRAGDGPAGQGHPRRYRSVVVLSRPEVGTHGSRQVLHLFRRKIEFRKAQDLVLLAFKKFSQTRRDCVLVTAWHSIWPKLSAGFKGTLTHAVELGEHGTLDIARWVYKNGIDRSW